MTAPQNLKALTALRFFAALWVVGFHYWPHLTAAAEPMIQAKGYLGVELFFVLSGFILSHVYLQEAGEGRLSYRGFIWARLARVYPLHIATLAGLLVLAVGAMLAGFSAGDNVLVWRSLPAQLLMLQAWGLGQGGGWNHPSWSISAEWFAYLTFPAFAFVTWSLRTRPWLAVGLAAVFVVALNLGFQAVAGYPLTRATLLWGALRIVPCFFLGCASYLLWRAAPLRRQAAAVGAALASAAAVIALAAIGAPDMVLVLTFGALIYSFASLATSGSRLLTGAGWVWLGEVSFAVYMVCIPWELVVTKSASALLHTDAEAPLPWFIGAVLALGVVPVAGLAHHIVELPARRAMRGMTVVKTDRFKARVAAASAR